MPIRTQSVEQFKRSAKIEIGNPGIKRALRKYNIPQSIAEFVWNGFDAGASEIEIDFQENELGGITTIEISDNGSGIPFAELDRKFGPFLHSSKSIDPQTVHDGPSAVHGKNGIGRLTFFTYAERAQWWTTYSDNQDGLRSYQIRVDASQLNSFRAGEESAAEEETTGTLVVLSNVSDISKATLETIKEHLVLEFAWLLELKSPVEKVIRINGEPLSYQNLIADSHDFTQEVEGNIFEVRYVRWGERLHREYSRYYFLDSGHREKAKKTTSLNNKGDGFYHSVYVRSEAFDGLQTPTFAEESSEQTSLVFDDEQKLGVAKELITKLDQFLKQKRQPFLRHRSLQFYGDMEKEKALPAFSNEPWDQHRKRELELIVREIYEVEPKIFAQLNFQQKQTMMSLFSLVMDSGQRDRLLDVLGHVVALEPKEREDLSQILLSTQLSNIVSTIQMITDRFVAVDELKSMVFNPNFGANERDHLQAYIQRHYWLFGEQYHLVTAAEQKFGEAMRRFTHLLHGKASKRKIVHPDKNKEMDVFAVRILPKIDAIENIVVELKHPSVCLGEPELAQVKTYMGVILEQPEFNASNMEWTFYLIGNNYDSYIEREMKNAQMHGEKALVYKLTNPLYRIYVFKWSEIFTQFELRHKFILEKLKVERDKIATTKTDADTLLANAHLNSASAVVIQ